MKAVILAGGLGTRLAEETSTKPKPMVEIGGRPIIWHIMKIYSHYGINDFVVCCGYKGYLLKEYFANYLIHNSDIKVCIDDNSVVVNRECRESWTIELVDTGDETMTGGRLKRVVKYLPSDAPFCLTYGDGVADIDISELIKFHNSHGRAATLTGVLPPGRFGALDLEGASVKAFLEKPKGDGAYVNGGFFVLSPSVISEIAGDETVWEQEPLNNLAKAGDLQCFLHDGFWQPMDTLRDKIYLQGLWEQNAAPWKVWEV